jgi:hypothetical protein
MATWAGVGFVLSLVAGLLCVTVGASPEDVPEGTSVGIVWQGIAFDQDLEMCWFGLRWEGKESSEIGVVRFCGVDQTEKVSLPTRLLKPGKTLVAGVLLPATCARGADLSLVISTKGNAEQARADVRVHNRFPILGWDQSPNGFGLDPYPFVLAREEGEQIYDLLMSCVTHTHGTYEEATRELARSYAALRQGSESTLGCIKVCNIEWEDGLTIFPPRADLTITFPLQALPMEGSLKPVNEFAATAQRGCAPQGWIAYALVAPVHEAPHLKDRPPTREELRYMIWEWISYGARGVLYDGSEEAFRASEIGVINQELREYLPSLIYAIPVEDHFIADGKVRVAVLQAGFDQLVVIVLNHTLTYSPVPPRATSCELLRNDVEIPRGLALDAEREGNEPVEYDEEKGVCSFTLKRLERLHVTRIGLREKMQGESTE